MLPQGRVPGKRPERRARRGCSRRPRPLQYRAVNLHPRLDALNRRVGIGTVAVLAVFGLLVTSWALMPAYPRAEVLRDVFLAGFVGGFTNTVAIRMLFTRYWFLPGSGVLLKEKDAIILSLADTMEAHILNPGLIETRVRQLAREIDKQAVADAINAIVDETRTDLILYVRAPEQRRQIVTALRDEGGFWGSLADSLGVMTYEVVADRLTTGIARQIESFTVTVPMVDAAMEKVGSLDDFILQPQNPFVLKHYGSDRSLAQLLFQTLDAKQLVIDRLTTYEPDEIRDIIADNIREHLAWLEVFGVLLGMAFATVAALVDLAL